MENTFSAANLGRAAKPSELICALAPEVSLLRRGRAFRQTLYPQRETASSPKSAPDLVRVFRDTTLALTLASSSTFFRHNQPVCAITDTDQAAPHNGPPDRRIRTCVVCRGLATKRVQSHSGTVFEN